MPGGIDPGRRTVRVYLLLPYREALLDRFDHVAARRERLLAVFRRPPASEAFRGCPFHNAAVELAGPAHPGTAVIHAHKQAFLRQLADTARQGKAHDPETLGRQLAVLFEGATALATSIDDVAPFDDARPVAAALIEQAIPADGEQPPGTHANITAG